VTKTLPHVTQVLDLLNKPQLIPWATGLGVEYMQYKTAEIVRASINKILIEIRDMSLIKVEAMREKLAITRENINKILIGDTSEIAKEAKLQPNKIRDEAADKGKRVHSAIEKFLQAKDGAEVEVDEDITKPFRKFMGWWILNDVEVVETECSVWSEEGGGFKGTFDLSAKIKKDGKKLLYLIDFKTSPRIYEDVKMQLASYFYGWKQRTNHIPERAAVLRLDFTDGPEEFFEILESDLYVHYQAFLKLVEFWHLTKGGMVPY